MRVLPNKPQHLLKLQLFSRLQGLSQAVSSYIFSRDIAYVNISSVLGFPSIYELYQGMLYTLVVFRVFSSCYSTGIIVIQCYSPWNRLLNFSIKTLQPLSLLDSFSQCYIFSFQGKECHCASSLSLLTYSGISYYSGIAPGRLSGLGAPSKVAIAIYYGQATQRVIQCIVQGLLIPYSRVANSEVSGAF